MDEDMAEAQLAIQHLLELNGIPYTDDTAEQMAVFIDCMRLYDDRSKSYGQAWKQYGGLANLQSAARKVDRLMESWWHRGEGSLHKDGLDDAFDGINYFVFFIRMIRLGRVTGKAPKRPTNLELVRRSDEHYKGVGSTDDRI
jgi:hypothetical protein